MNLPKLKWKVAESPTGMYRAFEKRNWPSASYPNGDPALYISCDDEYVPARVRTGEHAELHVSVAEWHVPREPKKAAFTWRRMKGTFKTLDAAKAAGENLLARLPHLWPEEYRPKDGVQLIAKE